MTQVLRSTEAICGLGYDKYGKRTFSNPSLYLKLGHSITKCCQLKKGLAIRNGDYTQRSEVELFLGLYAGDWTDLMSSPSLSTFKARKYNKPELLPLTSDLLKLKKYHTLMANCFLALMAIITIKCLLLFLAVEWRNYWPFRS